MKGEKQPIERHSLRRHYPGRFYGYNLRFWQ